MATLELILEKLEVVLEKNEKLEKVVLEMKEKFEKEVSQLRAEVKYLSEKLDQQPQSPSPTAATATTTATVARWTGGELTPNDKKSIQKKSEFSCSVKMTPPKLVKDLMYCRPKQISFRYDEEMECSFLDAEEGEYLTPIGGKYEFGLNVTLFGDALLKFFLVSKKMGWRREILTARKEKNKKKEEDGEKGEEGKEKQEETEEEEENKEETEEEEENKKEEEKEALNASFETESDYREYFDFSGDDIKYLDPDDFITVNGTVVVDCKEFVDVSISVVQIRGCPRRVNCIFSGKLIGFA